MSDIYKLETGKNQPKNIIRKNIKTLPNSNSRYQKSGSSVQIRIFRETSHRLRQMLGMSRFVLKENLPGFAMARTHYPHGITL